MNTLHYKKQKPKIALRYIISVFCCFISLSIWAQETETVQDSTKTGFSMNDIEMPNPSSITSKYTYDPYTDRYIYTESVGDFNINYPVILTPEEYQDLVTKENLRGYYQDKVSAFDGKSADAEEQRKNLLPEFYVNSGFFKTIFGGDTIEIIPQGSVEVDLGILFTKQDNPSFSPRNRTNFTFDFDQRISLSMMGKVGERLSVNANYDTESTFDFQNIIKLDYDPSINGGEDSILKKLEIGNVNMPINSSLITGAQSLFGVKTQLQFGKTTVTAVFSEQKSDTKTVVAQGGGTLDEFDFYIRDYDENRHFFLGQYFRNHYDDALENYPYLNTNVQITRIEVWITNRGTRTENVRNIVALQDLGEGDVLGSEVNSFNPGGYPDNSNNAFDPSLIGTSGNAQLSEAVRDIATAQSGFLVTNIREGYDYNKLENARKLTENQEYTYHPQLGYVSLNQRLNNDEVLAVAYQYTVGGKVYQVGEFANDGIDATDVETDVDTGEVTGVTNTSLILKLLKSSITSTSQPIWDLMMKNIYDTGAYQLSQEDFKLNIFYNDGSALNYISPVDGTPFPEFDGRSIQETTLLKLFNLDRLNYNGDPQANGDGFFDFIPGLTVLLDRGKIVFTSAEPFGEYLFETLRTDINEDYNGENVGDYNANQEKYVYDLMYKQTKTQAQDENEKNKFQIKGRYKSQGGDGIAIGAFNVPRGSVKVTAGGRVLVEGVDYTVNYQLGRVQILDEALKASNTPIQVSTENNSIFGQQTKRFTGINVEHQFSKDFLLGATYLNLSERPITQKANYSNEPINNTILGFNGNYSTEVPFLTRMANKLPNIDTDAVSNMSVRGEFAYLLPGSPKGTDFNGEATSYIDDFEGTQNGIDLKSPQAWYLSSRPLGLGRTYSEPEDGQGLQNGYDRAMLNWYRIDPTFYSNQRPDDISDDDVSGLYTSRVFIEELFPEQDVAQGQTTVLNTLDLAYYPNERGPYNFNEDNTDSNDRNRIINPEQSWAGITRQITSTDFEQANVEYIEFWLQDPFQENPNNPGGKLMFNLGNISEDVLKDGYKQYENGLPDGSINNDLTQTTDWGKVPSSQSLVYAFDTTGDERTLQDVGYDGLNDAGEVKLSGVIGSGFDRLDDPANDNYNYFLNTDGDILSRYKRYNGLDGNSPDTFSDTNRGYTTQPDVEDVNRDNTMNTIDSYFEYDIDITAASLNENSNEFIVDEKTTSRELPNGDVVPVKWYQFRIPVQGDHVESINEISDLRSIRFARMYLKDFEEPTIMRFGSLDLVRTDWRRYVLALNPEIDITTTNTDFSVGAVSTQENEGGYSSPPGVVAEQLNNNNTIIDQNEQALVLNVCGLESQDSRAVYKNISVDMRQFKRLRMFMHAEAGETNDLADNDLVGFLRIGNDLNDNYYQIEVPLAVSTGGTSSEVLWPTANEINIELSVLQKLKSEAISSGTISTDAIFYDVIGSDLTPVADPFSGYVQGQHRVGIKGSPNFGDVRSLMVGVKNASANNECAQVWFNELRMSDMDNEGGWAAVVSMDANIADFANISVTGRQSTAGFGGVEQGPSERSLEDVKQYDFVTNVNVGQLLPKKWGLQIPLNYGQGAELITPKYDQLYEDVTLDDRLNSALSEEARDDIREQSEELTKRKSVNLIGVRKNRTGESKPRFYDVENLTLNYSYNKVDHRDFEIENSVEKQVKAGVNYAYNFQPKTVEPFKKNDSIFKSKYFKFLKDFNINLLPASFTVNTNFNRQFNKQKFRDTELGDGNIQLEELFRRNYIFDFQYNLNWNLTKSLQFSFAASNNNIVRNYFIDNDLTGEQDAALDVWDGFFDFGDPNRQYQQLQVNYDIPFKKIPFLNFLQAQYSYTGDFQWQKGSDLLGEIEYEDTDLTDGDSSGYYNLGNSIQNSNTHNINSSLDMEKLYKYIGIKKKSTRKRTSTKKTKDSKDDKSKDNKNSKVKTAKSKSNGFANFGIGLLTSVKRIQLNYSENNGTYLPGYLQSPGFIGTLKPTLAYTFGGQSDIRYMAARNGWLTQIPEFNQQYSSLTTKQLDFTANLEPFNDLKIDLVGSRAYADNYTENYFVDVNGEDYEYKSLTGNTYGNFSISTVLIKTAFSKSDDTQSATFNDFRANRLTVARRLAQERGIDVTDVDADGFPKGLGKTNQAVLLPAFLAAYSGGNADKTSLGAFRNIPIPNWNLKYNGFMKMDWFKKRFKRFSLTHGYRSDYTINQFRTNLDYDDIDYAISYDDHLTNGSLDGNDNYKNETLYSNINLTEMFSPLVRIDFEMKNSIKILAEVRKDRLLSLSFDNNLLTEIQGQEYIIGLGYRIKDLRIKSKLAGPKKTIVSDLNMKADLSFRNNKTIIRYLDLENNQVTAGQTLWGLKYTADYAFSKNITGIFYFDYAFSEYAISTAFPQTTIRSGLTLRYNFGN